MRALSRTLPFAFFTVSGALALVYEVTWARYLGLFLGNTTLAHMCVLAAFTGGLAAGSFAIGSRTRHLRRPLAAYGWLEVAIGVYAVLFPLFIGHVQRTAISAAAALEPGSWIWVALKLAVSALVLLVPTVCMGGTYPVLMRHFQPASPAEEDKAEWLYLANCAGAVMGALAAGFILVPSLGLRFTMITTGSANVLLGMAAAAVGLLGVRPAPPAGEQSGGPPGKSAASGPARRTPELWLIYAAIAISGSTSMVYEIVWIRIFAITLGSSTYSFTLMLAAFISGLALGSLVVGLVPALRRAPLVAFAAAEIAIGLAVTAGLPLYERLPYIFWKWSSVLSPTPDTVWLSNLVRYALCFLVMVIPTLFFGMTLPLAIKTAARRDHNIGQDSGRVYGANTVGTLVGAVAAGLVLIPLIGLRGSLVAAILTNVVVGGWLLTASGLRFRTPAAVGASTAGVALVLLVPAWDVASFTRGTFRAHGSAPPDWQTYKRLRLSGRVLYYGEDSVATVAVVESRASVRGRVERTLVIDGKGEASAYLDMPTQVLSGQIPMLLKTDASRVLIVGLGSGVTAASVLTHPNARVDCVEISPAVVEGARAFADVNGDVLDHRRLRLIVEDARTVVATAAGRYDVVINEPSNPWIAGVGNLFSVEYFRQIRRVLTPGGLVAGWFHTYEIDDGLVRVILRTLRQVFPHCCVFQGTTNDYIVIGSLRPVRPRWDEIERRIALPPVRGDLARVSITSTWALLGCQVMSAQGVRRVSGTGEINSDDRPILEYRAPRAQVVGAEASVISQADERYASGRSLLLADYARRRSLDRAACMSLLRLYSDLRTAQPGLRRALLEHWAHRWPDEWAVRQLARLAPASERPRWIEEAAR